MLPSLALSERSRDKSQDPGGPLPAAGSETPSGKCLALPLALKLRGLLLSQDLPWVPVTIPAGMCRARQSLDRPPTQGRAPQGDP